MQLLKRDIDLLRSGFPILQMPSTLALIEEQGLLRSLQEGQELLQPGEFVKSIPLVLSGTLKVLRESEEGHELFLYYLIPGETCAMALTCCGSQKESTLRIVAEEQSIIIQISFRLLESLEAHKDWKDFISQNYAHRFSEMLKVIDSIAFQKMDVRLEQLLVTKTMQLKNKFILQTHQEIANELGTSREVISRLLKQMEKQGIVILHRNRIELLKV